jgi:hypothetical protein
VPRGGKRYGTQGKAYPSRTDLNVPAQAAKGQQYGKATAQLESQRQVPIARPATDNVPTAAPAAAAPGSVDRLVAAAAAAGAPTTPLDAPTARPDEPLTAGLPVGPGAGAEANPFSQVGSADDAIMAIRAAFQAYPSEELRMILERLDLERLDLG